MVVNLWMLQDAERTIAKIQDEWYRATTDAEKARLSAMWQMAADYSDELVAAWEESKKR